MRKLIVFNNVSLDGYFTDARGGMSFAHNRAPDPEWDAFVAGNAAGGGILIFGRLTYEMMASFWTTAAAKERMPAVAEGMSRREKLVFSRTLKSVAWSGSRLAMRGPAEEIAALKKTAGEGLAILGSGTIVSQLARAGLIDEYQFAVVPVALGKGRTLFDGVPEKIALTLKDSRAFRNGNVLLRYAPAGG